MEAEQFYSKFAAKNSELFDCAWGSRDFRQAAVAMARHFISPDATFDALDDILADAADHSTEIDQAHYGRAFGDHPRLTHSDIEKKRWICDEWHSFLGFGPFPIQDPITVVRSRRSTQPDKDVLKSALAEMLPELSSMVAEAVVAKLGRVPSRTSSEQAEEPMAESYPPTNATASQPMLPAPVDPPLDRETEPDASDLQPSPSVAIFPPNSLQRHVPRPILPVHPTPSCSPAGVVLVPTTPSLTQLSENPALSGHTDAPFTARATWDARASKPRTFLGLTLSDLELSPSPSLLPPHQKPPSRTPPATETESRKRHAPVPLESDWEAEEEMKSPPKRLRSETSSCAGLMARPFQSKEHSQHSSLASFATPSAARMSAASDWEAKEDMESPPRHLQSETSPYAPLTTRPFQSKKPLQCSSLASASAPSKPGATVKEQEELIRSAIRRMFRNPNSREKSREQMDALMAIMNEDPRDMVVVVKTGGGKSLLWTIPPLLGLDGISVVICPFKVLMEEQYRRCVEAGVRCHNYGWSKEVPEDVQNLFVQVEHVGSAAFQRHVI